MDCVIFIVPYLIVGIAVFIWQFLNRNENDPDHKKQATRAAILLPELCLLWPFILFIKFKNGKTVERVSHEDII